MFFIHFYTNSTNLCKMPPKKLRKYLTLEDYEGSLTLVPAPSTTFLFFQSFQVLRWMSERTEEKQRTNKLTIMMIKIMQTNSSTTQSI